MVSSAQLGSGGGGVEGPGLEAVDRVKWLETVSFAIAILIFTDTQILIKPTGPGH